VVFGVLKFYWKIHDDFFNSLKIKSILERLKSIWIN
jgi:hypothetical protein